MHCVISNCDSELQSHVQRFPRSSFLYERWRQAIELGTGEPFPRDVDPLEVVICQQHFAGFDGYQEPVIFLNESLNRQIQLDSCRLCLKFDFRERMTTGCGNRIVVEKTVENLVRTAFGIELSEEDRLKGICNECLEKLAMIESTLMYFSKKKDRWLQMQDIIEGESVQWHGNQNHEIEDIIDTKEQIFQETTSTNEEDIKVEIDDSKYDKVQTENPDQVEDNGNALLEELSVERTADYRANIPLVQIPMQTYEANLERIEQHQCSSCQMSFSSNSDYNNHCIDGCKMQLDITNNDPKAYRNQPQGKADTTNSRPFICQTCHKAFSSAAYLRKHEALHQRATKTKVFSCQYCTKQFRTRKAWRIHERFHENQQAYTCEICGKIFTHPANMKRHQQLHVGARKYGCDTCGKRFTRHTHLSMHQQVHTGEKPYECPKCGRRFASSSGFAKHRRNMSCIVQLAADGNGPRGK